MPGTADDSGYAWHAGVAIDIPVTTDLTIKADAIYGAYDADTVESAGFFLDAKALYNLGFAKIGLLGWYSSGTDDDDYRDKDFGYMPSYVTGARDNSGFGPSSMGFYGASSLNNYAVFGRNGIATWGIGLTLENFSFATDLSHTARILYYTGTDESAGNSWGGTNGYFNKLGAGAGGGILSEDDHAWEFNFDSTYKISKYLNLQVQLGLIVVDWDDNTTHHRNFENGNGDGRDTAYRATVGLYYDF
jgi:hypothetical protein